MPELPTCDCVRGLQPYDRLTAIYQAAAELSGDTSLPDAACVAGVPPFQRFPYIYAAFRDLAGGGSLPSQLCVAGESPQDQVARIYQAVAIYADDAALLSYECVRGMPIWQQWVEIYRALYSIAGPDGLTDPLCINTTFDVLSEVFCAILEIEQGEATLLASFYIPEIVDTFERAMAAGYTGNGDPDSYQREAAIDVLRASSFFGSQDCTILEDEPTECVLVAPPNIEATPGLGDFNAVWDDLPVTVSRASFEYQVPGFISWTSVGTNLFVNGVSLPDGTYTLEVQAISTSGVEGEVGVSNEFEVIGAGPILVADDNFSWATTFSPISDNVNWEDPVGVVLSSDAQNILFFTSSDYGIAYFGTVAASLNQKVRVKIATDAPTQYVGAAVRVQASGDCYAVYCDGTNWFLAKRISGVTTGLDSGALNLAIGDEIEVEVSGGSGATTRLAVRADTGSGFVDITTGIDPGSTYLGSGRGGIAGLNEAGRIDDFKWYNT